ncbi:MAG: carbohydrate ABC transporter permease [Christensenellales bacterium]
MKLLKSLPPRSGIVRDYDLKSPGVRAGLLFVYLACGLIALLSLFPLFWVIMAGFKDIREYMSSTRILPAALDPSTYSRTWSQLNIMQNYLNSLYAILGCVACALLFNGLLAYGLAILKPRGHKLVSSLVMVSLLIPATISVVPLYMNITHLGLGGFFTPLWLAAGANAVYVVLFRQFFQSIPSSILEAGRIDGCTQMQTFTKIVLPLSKPICMVVTIFAINGAWSDFLLPYLVLGQGKWQTVMVRLFVFSTQQTVNYDDLMRAVVFSMLPPVVLFFLFQKQLTENIVTTGIKG